MLLVQHIELVWQKDCRGGLGAEKRSKFKQGIQLPTDFFAYTSVGKPVHQVVLVQNPQGFETRLDCRSIREFDIDNSLRINPMEIILKENNNCEVRYRYDWHKRALPERYKYTKEGSRLPLNELAFELQEGDYGRAICNGRFIDWDTGIRWYEMSVVNVMLVDEKSVSLNCFIDNMPTHYYHQMAVLF